jgi:GT2 family glycosyltransferase
LALVSIIILNYNTFELTCKCIESVIKFTKEVDYEIVLVDNCSTECNADNFLAKFPTITLVKSKVNKGFANGNNQGIKVAKGKYILLLNSDCYLIEDAISTTLTYYINQKVNGVLTTKLIFPDGRLQHTARKYRSIWWEILDNLRIIPLLLPYKTRSGLMLGKYFKCDYNTPCDWVSGAYFLFAKNMLQELENQQLDETFFMYGEDHLWCYNFEKLGYKSFYFSESKVVHLNNGSTAFNKQLKLRKTMLQHEIKILEIRKKSWIYIMIFKMLVYPKELARIWAKQYFPNI